MSETSALPAPHENLRRQSSGEHAALYIRRLIFDGELRPGIRVPQDQIAQRLGISRIPVREALITLQGEGWVTIELHRGAFINALDHDWVHDHYELYGIIYGFAAQKATERYGSELARELTPILDEIKAAKDPRAVTQLAIAFHAKIVEAAASPRLKVMLRGMSGMVPGDFFELVPGAVDVERQGFDRITKAIARGDGDKAYQQYVLLMQRQGDEVVKVFEDRGLFADSGSDGRPAGARATRAVSRS
jgi:DNA-binding GntR family transcriptional regulator